MVDSLAVKYQLKLIYKIAFLPILLLIFSGCINTNKPEDQASFIQHLNSFDPAVVSLFPDRLPNNVIGRSHSSSGETRPNSLGLTLVYPSKRNYLELKDEYLKRAKYYIQGNSACLLKVNQERLLSNCSDFYAIPSSALEVYSIAEKGDLTEDKIEVAIIDNNWHFEINKEISEINWNNSSGYSQGVSFVDEHQSIVFWAVDWNPNNYDKQKIK